MVTIQGKVTNQGWLHLNVWPPARDGDSPRGIDYFRNGNNYGMTTILGRVTILRMVTFLGMVRVPGLLNIIATVGAADWIPYI